MDPKVEEALTKKVVEQEKGAAIAEAAKAEVQSAAKEAATNSKMEAEFAKEDNAKKTEDATKPTAKEQAAALEDKINEMVKAGKKAAAAA